MTEKFDIDNLTQNAYVIGKLNEEIINLLNLTMDETDILIGKDKIKYTLKHKHKFRNDEEYKKCIEFTPDIIANPDYVGVHPNGKSIEFIKTIDQTLVVAVRIKPKGILWVKTIFPITPDKLNVYKKSNTLKKC
ncbi:hypothetical protein HZI73_22200 [Vallitalea pronyensis]|uniref:Phage-Barnase-EndoU-ColicinE5/D-RelE like nuclease 3 domain-containing protein n=1 Tax=Vallitalea pronyensis TaxID=1348613 RepID=A0A8J8MNS6_9FIRM|nr:PBECR2 nuclease fold domain-containing protein [Vallitalea pronyensis]QUI24844.1 hypothetical protein HZI73_22200 [Vallitalea pronyensis]